MSLPGGLLVAWYGDDFTGSAAVMEVLTFAGLPSVLFLEPPTESQRAHFPNCRGLGIASTARTHSPEWMDEHLPPVFTYLKSLGAPLTHYKTCSTLDSSPTVGSIGRAIECALGVFDTPWVPILHAAPRLRRYQVFGHLFAAGPGGVFRLDRHPVMARHPVTPMDESDVAAHLGKQTALPIGLLDLEQLESATASLARLQDEGIKLVSLDTVDERTLAAVGGLLWETRGDGIFCVGSQGIEYALVAHWGLTPPPPPRTGRAERMVAVAGSVSAVTAAQLAWAERNGFTPIRFDVLAVLRGESEAAIERAVQAALTAPGDPVVFTARGPDDPAVAAFREQGMGRPAANEQLGEALGKVLARVLERSTIRRAVCLGGDTSGAVTRQLGVFALTALAPIAPGAALCRAHAADPRYDGLELALKGGQMGAENYLGQVKQGHA